MRRLSLHASALSDAEYDLYTSSLSDLAESSPGIDPNRSYDDVYYENLEVGIREARAWFKGRYSHLPASDIDLILKFFHSDLGQSDSLTGGQFFAALRLVIHAEDGGGVDRGLAFVQARPHSRSSTPSRHSHKPPLSPPLMYHRSQQSSHTPSIDRNPFSRRLSATQAGPQADSSHPIATVPQSHPQVHSPKITHNPFLSRENPTDGYSKHNVNTDVKTPPLPPRKQAPAPPFSTSLRNPPLILNTPSRSTPPVIPSSSTSMRATHITSPLMRQSLQASKVAQTLKKAEEQLEKERILQVLKTASSSRTRSTSPSRTSPIGIDEAGRVPPLPARRSSKSNTSSSSSSAGSQKSLEQVASASVMRSQFRSILPDRDLASSPLSESPKRSPTDLPVSTSIPFLAPPTHPDRKPTEASTPTAPESPSQVPRVFRSKSLHHPSPPPPLPRRRPGSVQLTPHATPESSPFFTSPHQQLFESRSETSALSGVSRHQSLSSQTRNGSRGRDQSNAINTAESPMANLQRTLASFQLKAQPKLDAARYKAEAGLSRRGYVYHSHNSPWIEEGEKGLIGPNIEDEDSQPGVDPDYEGADDEHSSEEMRGRRIAAGWDKGHADSLKWPVGEGWKPL